MFGANFLPSTNIKTQHSTFVEYATRRNYGRRIRNPFLAKKHEENAQAISESIRRGDDAADDCRAHQKVDSCRADPGYYQ